ncbi:MAG: hypothetical protein Q9M36_00005 [Sulfurovum sp.]|nr:hypothetical protein [Sulfurovum sp.]
MQLQAHSPLLARSQKQSTQAMNCFFQSAFDSQEQKLLLLTPCPTPLPTPQYLHQIYTLAKERFKVSKRLAVQNYQRLSRRKAPYSPSTTVIKNLERKCSSLTSPLPNDLLDPRSNPSSYNLTA